MSVAAHCVKPSPGSCARTSVVSSYDFFLSLSSTLHSPMASLLALPNELKNLILADLTTPDLLYLAATCKQFNGLARPLAYRHLTVNWRNVDAEKIYAPDLATLNRILDRDPSLDLSIKYLTFSTEGCIDTENEDIHIFGNGYRRDGTPNDILELGRLITRCNNLESLDISVALLIENKVFFSEKVVDVRDTDNSDCAWMRNLKAIRMKFENFVKDDWSPDVYSLGRAHTCLFYFPRIEVIDLAYWDPCDNYDAYNDVDIEVDENFWPLDKPPIAQHLTTLKLGFSPASAAVFEFVLRQTPNLQVFEVELFQPAASLEYRLNRLKNGLDYVKKTLTHIRIRFDVLPEYEGEFDLDTREFVDVIAGCLGSFKDYDKLTYLETSLHLLFGSDDSKISEFFPLADMLPPNLEELIITDDLYDFNGFQQCFEDVNAMAIFRTYLEDWRCVTPQLKRFTYDLRERGEYTVAFWDQSKNRNALRRMCRESGVEGKVLWDWE
jgi:hypothetical protein